VKLSVVIPAFDEQPNVRPLYERLTAVLERCADDHEIIFVDDCSRDGTLGAVRGLVRDDHRVGYLSFSRRFGHEIAIAAGLDRACGDAVIIMDADLQDPPELIEQLVAKWREGAQVAYAQRRSRASDSAAKRGFAYLFYRLLGRVAEVDIPFDTGNFRLMDRRVVDVVRSCREMPRFIRGLVPWAGFKQEPVPFDRQPRRDGRTGYSTARMLRLALDAVFSFSLLPLRLGTYLGGGAILLAIAIALLVVAEMIFVNAPAFPRGLTLLASLILFVGGGQLCVLGVLGAYIGHTFKNAQGRPLYIVAEANPDDRAARPEAHPAADVGGQAHEIVVRKHIHPAPRPPTSPTTVPARPRVQNDLN